jgi:hypothetical protein
MRALARFSLKPIYAEVILTVGLLFLVVAASNYFSNKQSSDQSSAFSTAGLTERELAVKTAKEQGQKEYSYETGFIPGIGRIGDPEAYKNDWERQAKEQLEDEKETL